MNIRAVLTLVVALLPPVALAADIAGIWKHTEEPGWLEIRMEDGVGTGTVVRNEVYPERVGRELLKGLVRDESAQGLWRGQIYVERLGEYQDAEISLPEPGMMRIKLKVGFVSRTIEWISVAEAPLDVVN